MTAPSGVLDVTVVYLSPEEHCCQESSDEEACPEEAWGAQDTQALAPGQQALRTPGLEPPLCGRRGLGKDVTTSGYSSVSSASPTDSGQASGGPGGAPPVYLRAAHGQQLEHTALPPPHPEVVFTVSPPQPPGELCSPTAGEEEKPVGPQRGGGGHELGLLEAVSVSERVPQWTSAEGALLLCWCGVGDETDPCGSPLASRGPERRSGGGDSLSRGAHHEP